MMQLADQIQQTFALCEEEKADLLQELQAAQHVLTERQEAASRAAESEQQAAELQRQLQAAQQAVLVAEQAASADQGRVESAASELAALQAQLQQALAEAELAERQQQQQRVPTPAGVPDGTLLASLRAQLGGVQETLNRMVAEQSSWQGGGTPAVKSLLAKSKRQLELVNALMGDGQASLAANTVLRLQAEQMRLALATHSPATSRSRRSRSSGLFGSPMPFSLRCDGRANAATPATVSDVFSSPYMASQTTLTVDYRDFSYLVGAVRGRTCFQLSWADLNCCSQT